MVFSRSVRVFTLIIVLCLGVSLPGAGQEKKSGKKDPNVTVKPEHFSALKYRMIGPTRGGRVTAVEGVPSQPYTFYMGATGGGVWKTADGGSTWNNLSDGFFKAGSIGAIAAAFSDPNVVYVGTGSACPRGNVSPGVGIYKSTDAGKTWKHAGLSQAGQIARVVVHPNDPNLVYAAALGNIFGRNEERGVYRSLDGGKNWKKVLYADDGTGAVDLSMDPANPRIIYAAFWRAERKPWTLIDGGEKGGVWKTTDGGDNWKKLEGGLPKGVLGRIGVAVSPANPNRVWVIVETTKEKEGGIYRSENGGKSWRRINGNHNLRTRAWYYNHIIADPNDENTVYVMNSRFYKSVDGGRSFSRVRVPHGDNHALWLNPNNSDIVINGNDGGANVSYNGGRTWSTQMNQPTAEFYRVTVDNQYPYRVYAAQQDNSTISVPSRPVGGTVTAAGEWYTVGGGESGHVAVDPRDPNIIYAGNYIGQITRLNRATGHSREVVAYPQLHDGLAGREIKYRFQWNAPIRLSPHDPDILYHASQYVHKSTDGGQSWTTISPDLTTNKDDYQDIPGGPVQHDHTGVELYTTIFAFEESPHEAGVLWAGTDDGRIHISRDAGGNWTEITPRGMPKEGTVNTIDLSAHGKGRATVSVYRYREKDFRPYIFRTDDYGRSWKSLADGKNGIPEDHFVRVVREDPDRKGLLYAGTEFGMYVSFDDGAHWQKFQLNLPVTPITDLAVHQKDLVVATQGRAFWVLDDLTPLHQLADAKDSANHLYNSRVSIRSRGGRFGGGRDANRPPSGALIHFYLAEKPKEKETVRLEILDGEGKVIRTFETKKKDEEKEGENDSDDDRRNRLNIGELKVKKGLNRFEWDLRYPKPETIKGSVMSLSNTSGPMAPPGSYQVRLTAGDWTQTRPFEVRKDPRWEATADDLKAQFDLTFAVRDKLTETHDAIRKIRSVREQLKGIARRAVKAGFTKEIRKAADEIGKKLTEIEKELIQTQSKGGQDPLNYPPRLDNQIAYLYSVVNRQNARPTEGSYELFEDLKREVQPHFDKLKDLFDSELPRFNTLLEQENVPRVIILAKD